MGIFFYTGKIHWISGSSVQPNIINLETGNSHYPVITKSNKAFAKFCNGSASYRPGIIEPGFYFTALYSGKVLRNVKKYEKQQFINEFAEYIV